MMEKTFDFAAVEARIAEYWEREGAFRSGRPERAGAEPFCIVIPPPNVTGNLHMGHALNNTLQDVLARYWRMKGRDVLWQPGTDHAGIATQMVVERRLAELGNESRREMGRAKFLEEVWGWKAESGGAIVGQLKRLGASCDWRRERFTLDEGLSKAVAKVFVQLHREGLIYRDKRLVNWDPKFQTAISDLEVQQVECKGSFKWSRDAGEPLDEAALAKVLNKNPNGHLYHFDYPVVDEAGEETGEVLTVATTRPETMLGDTARRGSSRRPALHASASAQSVRLPLVGRLIPVIADEYSDPEKGTGAVKITPAHDFNDFEVGRRHEAEGVRPINILDAEARVTLKGNVAFFEGVDANDHELTRLVETLDGVDRFDARATDRRHDGAGRPARAHRAAARIRSRTATARASSSSPGSPTNGTSTPRRWRSPRSPRCARARPSSRPRIGRRPISIGWRTSSRGACRASSGGAIRSRRGVRPGARPMSRRTRRRAFAVALADGVERGVLPGRGGRAARRKRRTNSARCFRATRMCSTPGSPRRCGRSPRSAGRRRPRS